MKVKKTVAEWLVAGEALGKLVKLPFPIGPSFRITRTLAKLGPELEVMHKKRMALYEKHGKLTEDGQKYEVPPPKLKAFQKEMEVLAKEEVSVELSEPIRIKTCGSVEVQPGDLAALSFLFEE